MKYIVTWNVTSVGTQEAVVSNLEDLETVKGMLEKEKLGYTVRRLYTREDVAYHKPTEKVKEDDDFRKIYGRVVNRVMESNEDFIFSFVISGLEEELEYKINKGMLKRALGEYKQNHPEEFKDECETESKILQAQV